MNGEASSTNNPLNWRAHERVQESTEQTTLLQETEFPLLDITNDGATTNSESSSPGPNETVEVLAENDQRPEGGRSSPRSPFVREIHKNSWLKKMPPVDRRPGRFTKAPRPEKFWVVFCVHDDKEAFLEFYENRRSAYSHKPLSSVSLSYCLHISPTLFVQENDHEFVITLSTEVIRLAASTREQMLEWMDTMRTKLRDLGVLDPKDNVYTKEPRILSSPQRELAHQLQASNREETSVSQDQYNPQSDLGRYSSRDPNSPLPPVPPPPGLGGSNSHVDVPSAAVMYVRNPPPISPAPKSSNVLPAQSSQENMTVKSVEGRRAAPCPSNVFNFDFVTDSLHESATSRESDDTASNISPVATHSSSSFNAPVTEELSMYEPLFYMTSISEQDLVLRGIGNPSYKNPRPQRRSESEADKFSAGRGTTEQRRLSSSMAGDIQNVDMRSSSAFPSGGLAQGLRISSSSSSEPSLSDPIAAGCSITTRRVLSSVSDQLPSSSATGNSPHSPPPLCTRVKQEASHNSALRAVPLPLDEGPPPYDSVSHQSPLHNISQVGNSSGDNSVTSDEMGKPLSLRESQVLKLQKEIAHKSGVRLMLRKKDCVNAIALVECFGVVWVAGWKQKEHPLLHNTFHIGDYIVSIAGQMVHNLQEAQKAIKNQPLIVEFIVRRVPYGRVFAIKREVEGQSLGIVRGGTAEIKEVKQDGLAAKYGLPLKAPSVEGNSLCNWALTEINHRPLNLFSKDNEIQDRLNAVGKDISILVQPIDLVKALKKQLKTLRSYKDYIVQ